MEAVARAGRARVLVVLGMVFGLITGGAVAVAPPASAAVAYTVCTHSWDIYDNFSRLAPLPSTSNHVFQCFLTNGDTGAGVRTLQRTLNQCYGRGLEVDGVFGDDTEAALRFAQEDANIGDDGEYGPVTREAIRMRWYSRATGNFAGCWDIP